METRICEIEAVLNNVTHGLKMNEAKTAYATIRADYAVTQGEIAMSVVKNFEKEIEGLKKDFKIELKRNLLHTYFAMIGAFASGCGVLFGFYSIIK